MTPEQRTEIIDKANEIVAALKPQIAGHAPDIQLVVLADLVATFIAGWSPYVREKALATHTANVRDLIPINEMIIFGPEGHPDKRMTRQ